MNSILNANHRHYRCRWVEWGGSYGQLLYAVASPAIPFTFVMSPFAPTTCLFGRSASKCVTCATQYNLSPSTVITAIYSILFIVIVSVCANEFNWIIANVYRWNVELFINFGWPKSRNECCRPGRGFAEHVTAARRIRNLNSRELLRLERWNWRSIRYMVRPSIPNDITLSAFESKRNPGSRWCGEGGHYVNMIPTKIPLQKSISHAVRCCCWFIHNYLYASVRTELEWTEH